MTLTSKRKEAEDIADDLVQGAKDTRARAPDAVDRAANHAKDALQQGRRTARDAFANSGDFVGRLRSRICQEPVLSIVIALGTGWLVGRFMRP